MDDKKEILEAIEASRKERSDEMAVLTLKLDKVCRKIWGEDPEKEDEDSIVFKVKIHHNILRPIIMYLNFFKDSPVKGVVVFLAAFHTLAYASFKGMDHLLPVIKLMFKS